MVCSKLIWASPPKEELLTSAEKFQDAYKAQFERDNRHKTAEEVAAAVAGWRRQKEGVLAKKFRKAVKGDFEKGKSFTRLGWLAHEPVLSKDLGLMLTESSKFRLADLAYVNVHYLCMFMKAKIAENYGSEVAPELHLLEECSPIGERWATIPSQVEVVSNLDLAETITEEEAQQLLDEHLLG